MASANLLGIALIGNPGTGKSTILNGLVGRAAFCSGISYGTGLTTRLQEYKHSDGRSYFDTPGLDDIDKRKEAGLEIDRLLREDKPLKIIFVVFVINGRARTEDAATLRLVLNAIQSVTDNQFGVIINQAQKEVVDTMRSDPFKEKKVRTSITGNRLTEHWCYVTSDEELSGKDNGLLMNDELRNFFERVPETRAKGVSVEEIDTASFDEKLAEAKQLFDERERLLQQELSTQKMRTEMLDGMLTELKRSLKKEEESNGEHREQYRQRNEKLEEMIEHQRNEIESAKDQAKNIRLDFTDFKRMARENEDSAREEMETLRKLQKNEKEEWDETVNGLRHQIHALEKRRKCTIM